MALWAVVAGVSVAVWQRIEAARRGRVLSSAAAACSDTVLISCVSPSADNCPRSRNSPAGSCWSQAKTLNESPSKTERGKGETQCGVMLSGHARESARTLGERKRANMRSTAGSTASPGATKSQAPPLASARRRRCVSAGLLPMPTMNKRCPDCSAASRVLSMALISPSVTSSTSQSPVVLRAKVEVRAASISVPPRLASSALIQRCAARRVIFVSFHKPRERCSTVLPKRDREKRSVSSSCCTMACSARWADWRLSPDMEPEQSTSSLTLVAKGAAVASRGQKLARMTWLPAACGSVAWMAMASWAS